MRVNREVTGCAAESRRRYQKLDAYGRRKDGRPHGDYMVWVWRSDCSAAARYFSILLRV